MPEFLITQVTMCESFTCVFKMRKVRRWFDSCFVSRTQIAIRGGLREVVFVSACLKVCVNLSIHKLQNVLESFLLGRLHLAKRDSGGVLAPITLQS
jgi:hypothetical protein